MTFLLIARHGPVALEPPYMPTRAEFLDYVSAYEQTGLRADARAPLALSQRFAAIETIYASDTPRARASAALLAPGRNPIVDAIFSEEPQHAPDIAGRWPLLVWFALTRGGGAFLPSQARARSHMRQRAEAAATVLTASAAIAPTALIGHGWFNRAIARVLAEKGWRRGEGRGGTGRLGRVSSTWGFAVYAPPQRTGGA